MPIFLGRPEIWDRRIMHMATYKIYIVIYTVGRRKIIRKVETLFRDSIWDGKQLIVSNEMTYKERNHRQSL